MDFFFDDGDLYEGKFFIIEMEVYRRSWKLGNIRKCIFFYVFVLRKGEKIIAYFFDWIRVNVFVEQLK